MTGGGDDLGPAVDRSDPGLAEIARHRAEAAWFVDAGRLEEAHAAATAAVDSARRLADAAPREHAALLAVTLCEQSERWSALGGREAAHDTAWEAVVIDRSVASRTDQPHLHLSTALARSCLALVDLGRLDEGIDAGREAAALAHHARATDALVFARPHVALAAGLTHAGRSEAALDSVGVAVEALRSAEADRPADVAWELAEALAIAGVALRQNGSDELALQVAEEAVARLRVLAQWRPERAEPELADALACLSACLETVGRRDDAIAAVEEALARLRPHVAARPGAYLHRYAVTLQRHGLVLRSAKQVEPAMASAAEAVECFRQLAALHPSVLDDQLGGSLMQIGRMRNLAWRQADARRRRDTAASLRLDDAVNHGDGLAEMAEAVRLFRQVLVDHPDRGRAPLAGSLDVLAGLLVKMGRKAEALELMTEAVHHFRVLAAEDPRQHRKRFAVTLIDLSTLRSAGYVDNGTVEAAEAVAVLRELAAEDPDRGALDLSSALVHLSLRLADSGAATEAHAALTEGLSIRAARPDDGLGSIDDGGRGLLTTYLEQCQAAGVPPDPWLVHTIGAHFTQRFDEENVEGPADPG